MPESALAELDELRAGMADTARSMADVFDVAVLCDPQAESALRAMEIHLGDDALLVQVDATGVIDNPVGLYLLQS